MPHPYISRRPLKRFLLASLLFAVGIVTHTLLTDPHFGRPLFDHDYTLDSNSVFRLATVSSPVSPDAPAAGTLLGISIESDARSLPLGGSLRLQSVGHFVSGTVPVVATWKLGHDLTPPDCEGSRKECVVRGEKPGPVAVTASVKTFSATAKLIVPQSNGKLFRDALPDWSSAAVLRLFNQGVINGYDDGRYGPADTLTHGHVLALLGRIVRKTGVALPVACQPPFDPGHYAANSYCLFASRGWLLNDGFSPDAPVTRADTAAYVRRIFFDPEIVRLRGGTLPLPATPVFKDIPLHHAAFDDTATASSLGIMLGHPDGRFGPDELLNRAEAAVLAERILHQFER